MADTTTGEALTLAREALVMSRRALMDKSISNMHQITWDFGEDKCINKITAALAAIDQKLAVKVEPVGRVTMLSRDEARLALWQAIKDARKVGNATDDKLILEALANRLLFICRADLSQPTPGEAAATSQAAAPDDSPLEVGDLDTSLAPVRGVGVRHG